MSTEISRGFVNRLLVCCRALPTPSSSQRAGSIFIARVVFWFCFLELSILRSSVGMNLLPVPVFTKPKSFYYWYKYSKLFTVTSFSSIFQSAVLRFFKQHFNCIFKCNFCNNYMELLSFTKLHIDKIKNGI